MNDFLKSIVPMLGTAVSTVNPLAGLAINTIGKALGIETNDRKDIEKALQNSTITQEQLLALKKAEQDFTIKMQELGYNSVKDLEAIAAGDRDSARKREIAIHDLTPAVLAYVITVGFFGVLGYMLSFGIPETHGDALLVMLGSLGTAWAGCISYYFGSSSGSAKKDNTIAGLSK